MFQDWMRLPFIAVVEQATGRKVDASSRRSRMTRTSLPSCSCSIRTTEPPMDLRAENRVDSSVARSYILRQRRADSEMDRHVEHRSFTWRQALYGSRAVIGNPDHHCLHRRESTMDNRLQDVQVERPRPGAAVVVFTGEHDLSTSKPVEALLGSLIVENELVVVDCPRRNSSIRQLFTRS